MKYQNRILFILSVLAIAFGSPAFASKPPALVIFIVIDQFRADYLTRFHTRFLPAKDGRGLPGGFNYLIANGAYYPFMQYDILQCMTGPGHATLLSGSYPYRMGVPINSWFDQKTQQEMYCVQDKSQSLVGADTPGEGFSPKNMAGDTVGDQLKNAGYPSRVVSISLKNRAAILMGGHRADLALWFEPDSFRWVSSTYYLHDGQLPSWVSELNRDLASHKGLMYDWFAAGKGTGFSVSDGRPFGHRATIGMKDVLNLPYGLEITESAAEKAVQSLRLGRGTAPDLLAVSFSSHDGLGHLYGPNSREMEEMTVSEDRVIARFLGAIDRAVPGGLKRTLVVLTADHGMAPSPSWLKSVGVDAGTISNQALRERVEKRLDEKFGRPASGKWLAFLADFNFFLSESVLKERGAARSAVEAEVKEVLNHTDGIAEVFTRSEFDQRRLPPGLLGRVILKTYYAGRSGDVIAIPKPYYIHDDDPVSHMTAYSYDRTVPFVMTGEAVRRGTYAEAADAVDVAPTLSFILGVLPPNLSEGRVLSEMIRR